MLFALCFKYLRARCFSINFIHSKSYARSQNSLISVCLCMHGKFYYLIATRAYYDRVFADAEFAR